MEAQAPSSVLKTLSELGIVPVVRAHTPELGYKVVKTLAAAGFRTAEVTMTVPGAIDVIEDLSREGDLLIGAGTVLNVKDAEASIRAGASYVVSPCVVKGVAEVCREAGVFFMMSGLTPTEIMTAWHMGSGAVKVFPANSVGGPSHLRSIKVVFPFIPLVPTGGVNLGNVGEYLRAGAAFVGAGTDLVNVSLVERGTPEAMIDLGRKYLKAVAEARHGG